MTDGIAAARSTRAIRDSPRSHRCVLAQKQRRRESDRDPDHQGDERNDHRPVERRQHTERRVGSEGLEAGGGEELDPAKVKSRPTLDEKE